MTAALSTYELGCRDVLLIEKARQFGGTSALSGGVIWIPCNRYAREAGQADSLEEAHEYLRRTIPDDIRRDDMIAAYLENGPKLIDFLHGVSHARYMSLSMYPDYHSHIPGAKMGNRALESTPFDSALLGSSNDVVSHSHPIWYLLGRIPLTLTEANAISVKLKGWQMLVGKLLFKYAIDIPWRLRSKYDRMRKVGGSGVGRLFLSLKERGVPMWLNAPMIKLIEENGRVVGAVVNRDGRRLYIEARKGVVLASGGFEHNQADPSGLERQRADQHRRRTHAGAQAGLGNRPDGQGLVVYDHPCAGRGQATPDDHGKVLSRLLPGQPQWQALPQRIAELHDPAGPALRSS
jgi:3-oxosteroid 1-dehydrogenase